MEDYRELLEPGIFAKLRDGDIYVCVGKKLYNLKGITIIELNSYDKNLNHCSSGTFDIMKLCYNREFIEDEYEGMFWEREILTKEEEEFIRQLDKVYGRIDQIKKVLVKIDKGETLFETISIGSFKGSDIIKYHDLPPFPVNTKFRGMEYNRVYYWVNGKAKTKYF